MQAPSHNHQGIYTRNFLTLLVFLSFVVFVHFQLNQATSNMQNANSIINAILRNQTYSISSTELQNLQQSLKQKSYSQLSQSQCLMKIYFDVIKNEKFLVAQVQTAQTQVKSSSYFDKKELLFNQLKFPTTMHDFKKFKNCSDIITMMNYLNENKVDFIYTSVMQERHQAFRSNEEEEKEIVKQQEKVKQEEKTKKNKKQSKQIIKSQSKPIQDIGFCIIVNQFNTSLTKLRSNINSLVSQSYSNYKIIILDNGSGDGSYQIAKVILSDLKQKQTKQQPQNKQTISNKYKVIKEQQHVSSSLLYAKHSKLCDESDYVIFIDGRDQLASRHVLSIISNEIHRAVNKPHLVTGSTLQRKQLNRLYPFQLSKNAQSTQHPVITFKTVLLSTYESLKQTIVKQTLTLTHPVLIQGKVNEIILKQIPLEATLQIDQMLYVYDSIENKQKDRNPYFIQIVKMQAEKIKKNEDKK